MVSICRQRLIDVEPGTAWAALADWSGLRERLVPGFVVNLTMDGEDRILTFFNGMVLRERRVGLSETDRRLVWTVTDEAPFTHHNGATQILSNPDGTTSFVWTTDLLPDDLGPQMSEMMDCGLDIIKQTLEASAAS